MTNSPLRKDTGVCNITIIACLILSMTVCDPLPFASARVLVCAYGQYADYVRRQTALLCLETFSPNGRGLGTPPAEPLDDHSDAPSKTVRMYFLVLPIASANRLLPPDHDLYLFQAGRAYLMHIELAHSRLLPHLSKNECPELHPSAEYFHPDRSAPSDIAHKNFPYELPDTDSEERPRDTPVTIGAFPTHTGRYCSPFLRSV